MNNMKRNIVKLHDSVCFIVQENEESKRERKLQTSLLKELCQEVKLLVFNFLTLKKMRMVLIYLISFNRTRRGNWTLFPSFTCFLSQTRSKSLNFWTTLMVCLKPVAMDFTTICSTSDQTTKRVLVGRFWTPCFRMTTKKRTIGQVSSKFFIISYLYYCT